MNNLGKFTAAAALALSLATPVFAGGHANWTAVPEQSSVAFGSIKSNNNGEVHHFERVSGKVSETGELTIDIDVTSVQTNIDIRNERMGKLIFADNTAKATVTAEIDMEDLKAMAPGDTKLVEVQATLKLGAIENDVDANLLVARLSEDKVLVSTADFIMLSTEDLGINDGIDGLMNFAKLPGITRVTPVAIRMVFTK